MSCFFPCDSCHTMIQNSGLIFCSLVFVTKVKCYLIKIDFPFPFVSFSSHTHFEQKSLKTQVLNSLSLQYRLPEQTRKSNDRRKQQYKSLLFKVFGIPHSFPSVWYNFVCATHLFPHLNNHQAAGSPSFSKCIWYQLWFAWFTLDVHRADVYMWTSHHRSFTLNRHPVNAASGVWMKLLICWGGK